MGAHVTLVDGLISDCGRMVAERKDAEGWFDVSTLKEPYRIEGKKTMGYEVAEQLGWTLPDAIFYPAGGGVGLIGMWKAFRRDGGAGLDFEQAAEDDRGANGGLPAGGTRVRAWRNRRASSGRMRGPWPPGCACRSRSATLLMLDAIRKSGGTAIAVSDEELLDACLELSAAEGIFAAPEGGACVAALKKLLANGFLKSDERIVLYNTGAGLKYLEVFATRFPRTTASEQDKLGGLITPR